MIIWTIYCIKDIIGYDLNTFWILGQKFVKIFGVFLENQKDILKSTDL